MHHLETVESERDVFVPSAAILEADLVMKTRGYDYKERRSTWHALEYRIPATKILPNSISSVRVALDLQEGGMDYFDSLITSAALEHKAVVITTDRAVGMAVQTEW